MRAIQIIGTYKNGQKARVGWYNGKNADMVENPFTLQDYEGLVRIFNLTIGGKFLKGSSITIRVEQSYSLTSLGWFSLDMAMTIYSLERKEVFDRVNHILNFNPLRRV